MGIDVDHAYHALALDERRPAFRPTLWYIDPARNTNSELMQVWVSEQGAVFHVRLAADVVICSSQASTPIAVVVTLMLTPK